MSALPNNNAETASAAVPPGWYADPMGGTGERYWDGIAWSEHFTRERPQTQAQTQAQPQAQTLPQTLAQSLVQSQSAPAKQQVAVPVAKRSGGSMSTVAAAIIMLVAGVGIYSTLLAGESAKAGWDSEHGREVRSSFIEGCNRSSGGAVNCECAFNKLSTTPPYDTPQGFMKLADGLQRYRASGNPNDLPRIFVDTARACRIG